MQDLPALQINPGNDGLDRADYTAPTRQHELDHTTSGIDLPDLP